MKFYKTKVQKKSEEFVKSVQDFSLQNKDALCIMADPKTNAVVITYKGLIASVRNKGSKKTVKDLIYLKSDSKNRDIALNQFFSELDGALFAISEQMYTARLGGDKSFIDKLTDSIKFGTQDLNEKGNAKEIVSLN